MRIVLYDRYPEAVAMGTGVALALAVAALVMQRLGENLTSAYLFAVISDPRVRNALHQANADLTIVSESFLLFARSVWIMGSVAAALALGVVLTSPPRSAMRWTGILALELAVASLWAQWYRETALSHS